MGKCHRIHRPYKKLQKMNIFAGLSQVLSLQEQHTKHLREFL